MYSTSCANEIVFLSRGFFLWMFWMEYNWACRVPFPDFIKTISLQHEGVLATRIHKRSISSPTTMAGFSFLSRAMVILHISVSASSSACTAVWSLWINSSINMRTSLSLFSLRHEIRYWNCDLRRFIKNHLNRSTCSITSFLLSVFCTQLRILVAIEDNRTIWAVILFNVWHILLTYYSISHSSLPRNFPKKNLARTSPSITWIEFPLSYNMSLSGKTHTK